MSFVVRRAGFVGLLVLLVIGGRLPADDTVLTLPFELASNKIYMEAKVNGQGAYPFVVDTGAPFTVLDWDVARELEITVHHTGEVGGAGEGTTKLGTAQGVRIAIGGLRYQPRRMEVIPLNSILAQAEGRDVMGLVGGDVLSRFVSEFDFQAKELRLHSAHDFRYEGPGSRVPVTVQGHVLARATVVFEGREPIRGRFIVDTGARIAVSLNTHVVDDNRLLAADIPHIRTTIGWGIGGALEQGLARAVSLRIGDVTFNAPTVTLAQDTRGVFANRSISGVIGTEVLKRCRVFLDYGREHVILEPVEAAMRTPFPADASGLFITASGPGHRVYTIRTVVEASPASEAGLQPGDVIERVDGAPADGMTLEELRNRLREAGRTFEFDVRRDAKPVRVKFTTRELI